MTKSDRTAKTDITKVGKRGPFNVYAYRYLTDAIGTLRVGYMAQEVAKLVPEAVGRIGEHLALDYSKLPEIEHA